VSIAKTEIAQQRTVRLIPTAHYKPPILRALVDSDRELDALAALEGLTSARLNQREINPDFEDWAASCVEAAFAYRRKGGNRFNDEKTGAWYAAFEERTALAEVAFHKTRELGFIGRFDERTEYHALHASFIGHFHDIRGDTPPPECLEPDVAIGYPAGQAIARALIEQKSRGLIYPSVRNDGGTCLVAFQEIVVQDVLPGARWKITWAGSPDWAASAI
jgi:RES domain-containing protein